MRSALSSKQPSIPARVAVGLSALLLAGAGTPRAAVAGLSTGCVFPPRGEKWLPATCSHGPIQFLRQYPVLSLATRGQRARAQKLHDDLVAAAKRGHWNDLDAIARAGYHSQPAPRKPGDAKIHYFHAEHPPEARTGSLLDVERPKAIIYANAPGRPLVLVGAMWTTKPNEPGPTPGGPITRWHSHLSCTEGSHMANMPDMARSPILCPAHTHLHVAPVEMMHIWFTHDLRSAFALTAPEPELCKLGFLPATHCNQ